VEKPYRVIIVVVVMRVAEMIEGLKKGAIEEMEIVAGVPEEMQKEETNGNVSIYLKKSLPLPGFK
jgi:hypothetical protein